MLDDFYKKILVIQEFDIVKETIKIINRNSDFLSDLLAIQLAKGKDGNNENVTVFGRDYYSDFTIYNKQRNGVGLGKVTDVITNYFSGAFYRGLKVKTQGTEFFIESDVPYFDEILVRSGNVIMELNTEHLQIFRDEILVPQLQASFNLKFNGV